MNLFSDDRAGTIMVEKRCVAGNRPRPCVWTRLPAVVNMCAWAAGAYSKKSFIGLSTNLGGRPIEARWN